MKKWQEKYKNNNQDKNNNTHTKYTTRRTGFQGSLKDACAENCWKMQR